MTKERRLAIKMWEGIRDSLADKPKDTSYFQFVVTYKDYFCKVFKLHWDSHCWFCQYIRRDRKSTCKKCPLKSCCTDEAYYLIVTDIQGIYTVQERVDACNKIIAALKGAGTRTNSDS